MPRLLGVDIPNDRPTIIALTYLYGVGPKIARDLCHKAGVDPQVRARELREDELARMAALLDKDYVVEGQLRRQRNQNIMRLRTSAATGACGIAAGCRSAASAPAPTPAPARARRRPWPARRASRTCGK